MRIEKIKSDECNKKDLEKIYVTEPSAIFIFSDPKHKPVVQVFGRV